MDPVAIACAMIAMLAMQLLEEGGVASKLLNRGSGWIRPTFCTQIFVSVKRYLFSNLHALSHRDEAHRGGLRCHRVRHA